MSNILQYYSCGVIFSVFRRITNGPLIDAKCENESSEKPRETILYYWTRISTVLYFRYDHRNKLVPISVRMRRLRIAYIRTKITEMYLISRGVRSTGVTCSVWKTFQYSRIFLQSSWDWRSTGYCGGYLDAVYISGALHLKNK